MLTTTAAVLLFSWNLVITFLSFRFSLLCRGCATFDLKKFERVVVIPVVSYNVEKHAEVQQRWIAK